MIRSLLVSVGNNSISKLWRYGLSLVLIGFMSGCGGGGGGGGNSSASTSGGGSGNSNASAVVGVAMPSNVSVVTAQNAGN